MGATQAMSSAIDHQLPGKPLTEESGRHADPVLEVRDLSVQIRHGSGLTSILEGLSYNVYPSDSVAIVGESGAGKSVGVRAVLDLLDRARFQVSGKIRLCGVDLVPLSTKARRTYISSVASLVFQDPTRSLNPTMRVGWQIAEAMYKVADREHRLGKAEARTKSIQLMREVGIADPEQRFHAYPHQLSGGMRQRVVIAIALSCEPKVMFCDEPTSSLDVTTQALIMDLLDSLRDRLGLAIVLITHDLALAASRTREVMVMYAGRLVESLPAADLFGQSSMPYTRALLASLPTVDGVAEAPSAPSGGRLAIGGCSYRGLCPHGDDRCARAPDLIDLAIGHRVRCWHPVLSSVGATEALQ